MQIKMFSVIGLVILGSLLLHRFSPVSSLYEFNKFWVEKTHGEGNSKFDALICGDSRVYRGVSSEVVASHLAGYKMFNFGYSSGSYSSFMLDQIEKHIDPNGAPILILGITPYSLTDKAALDEHIKQELRRKKEEILEYLYLQPLKNFVEPIDLNELLTNKNDESTVKYNQKFHNNDGWVASSKIPSNPSAALGEYARDFENNKVSSIVIAGLMNRISIWTLKGYKVYGFRPPTTQAMEALEIEKGGFNEQEFVTLLKRSGGKWLHFNSRSYVSYDGSHLEEQSAISFSHDLGRVIESDLMNRY